MRPQRNTSQWQDFQNQNMQKRPPFIITYFSKNRPKLSQRVQQISSANDTLFLQRKIQEMSLQNEHHPCQKQQKIESWLYKHLQIVSQQNASSQMDQQVEVIQNKIQQQNSLQNKNDNNYFSQDYFFPNLTYNNTSQPSLAIDLDFSNIAPSFPSFRDKQFKQFLQNIKEKQRMKNEADQVNRLKNSEIIQQALRQRYPLKSQAEIYQIKNKLLQKIDNRINTIEQIVNILDVVNLNHLNDII